LGALKRHGYVVAIYYFALANAQLAIRRVKLRVTLGGHDVPTDVVRRRFVRSLNNFFNLYLQLADEWSMFDNSTSPHALTVATSLNNQLTIMETATWNKLQKISLAA
jgi:predicted ABC-type ATPase